MRDIQKAAEYNIIGENKVQTDFVITLLDSGIMLRVMDPDFRTPEREYICKIQFWNIELHLKPLKLISRNLIPSETYARDAAEN